MGRKHKQKQQKKKQEREQAMNLSRAKETVVQTHESPGLIRVQFKYKVTSAEADVAWMGPKIPKEEWQKMLAFFKWTNTEHHSESQVRMFVNPSLNTWKIWAFPQQARTGMSAREISGEDFDKQRAEFKDEEGWIYFGTVHHHCNMGAFQSGTDLDNEISQDGLHITIGKLDQQSLDMHCRFCMAGSMFEPNMSWFWDIGEDLAILTPFEVHNIIARHQMTISPAKETAFPDKWKENVIELKGGSGGYAGTFWYPGQGTGSYFRCGYEGGSVERAGAQGASNAPSQNAPAMEGKGVAADGRVMMRVHRAESALRALVNSGFSIEEIIKELSSSALINRKLMTAIMEVGKIWAVDSQDILKEAKWEQSKAESKAIRDQIDRANDEFAQAQLAEYYGID